MNKEELSALINRITEEVLYRLRELEPADENVSGTVVIVSSFIPSPKTALETVHARYGKDAQFITFGTSFTPIGSRVVNADEQEKESILEQVAGSANVVLMTPKVGLLSNIAQGNDEGFIEHLIMRSLLWGRKVSVLLDFKPPRFKRNTFYEKIVTVIETLSDMGMEILSYQCAVAKDGERLTLVTENEVVAAYKTKEKQVLCAPRAIITPSARDKAKELGVDLNY